MTVYWTRVGNLKRVSLSNELLDTMGWRFGTQLSAEIEGDAVVLRAMKPGVPPAVNNVSAPVAQPIRVPVSSMISVPKVLPPDALSEVVKKMREKGEISVLPK
jgi:hypothetical protein